LGKRHGSDATSEGVEVFLVIIRNRWIKSVNIFFVKIDFVLMVWLSTELVYTISET
jgi:hypothetical protein